MVYNLDFDRCYLTCRVLKERETSLLINFISNARLGREIVFKKYCNILFSNEDEKHEHPIVTELDSFSRNKVNGLLYDVLITDNNNDVYNKCLIYHTEEHPNGFYGFMLWHTEKENKPVHIAYIESEDFSDLIIRINNCISNIKTNQKYMNMLEEQRKLYGNRKKH